MKNIILLLLTFLSIGKISAQKFELEGIVLDSLTQKAVEPATIFVKSVKDSSLISYTINDKKGHFSISGKTSEKEILFYISFLGYRTFHQKMKISSPQKNLGNLFISPEIQQLSGITIEAERPPISIRKDTLEFNVNSFHNNPEATLEDVLKQIPGVEVDENGKIKVNGQPVQEITINGQKFFNNDSKIALKNLTKDIIEKIQVSNVKSDKDKILKRKGKSDQKTLNIQLKKDKNKGFFGRISGGYGTNKRYDASTFANYFNDKQQVSLIAGTNNINASGFSNDEISKMGNAFMMLMSGITTSEKYGVNYSNLPDKKVEINANHLFSKNISEQKNKTETETFLPDRKFFTERNSQSNSVSKKHSSMGNFQYVIDSTSRLGIRTTIDFSETQSTLKGQQKTFNQERILANESETLREMSENSMNFNNVLNYSKSFGKKLPMLSVLVLNQNSRENSHNNFRSNRNISGKNQTENQRINNLNTYDFIETGLAISQPIGTKIQLGIYYDFSLNKKKNQKNTFDIDAVSPTLNKALSSDFNTQINKQKIMVGGEFEDENLDADFSIGKEIHAMKINDFLHQIAINKHYENWFLKWDFSYKFSEKSRINVWQNYSFLAPTEMHLQPVVNISNPLHTFVGNPNLDMIQHNSFNFFYSWRDPNRVNLVSSSVIDFKKNNIIRLTKTNPDLTTHTTYVNTNETDWDFYISLHLFKRIKWEKSNVNFSLLLSHSTQKSHLFLESEKYTEKLKRYTTSLSISHNIDDLLETRVRYSPSYSTNNFSIKSLNSRNNLQHRTHFENTLWLGKFILGNDLQYIYNPNLSANFRNSSFLWNASIGVKLWGDQAKLYLRGYDLLNQISGTNRLINGDSITNTENLVLEQYFMLSFNYKFNKMGGSSSKRKNFRNSGRNFYD